jgi:hypothetical protein
MKIEKARRMASEDRHSRASIYYGESVIKDFGPLIPPREKDTILRQIRRIEQMDEYGTYEENVMAIDDLQRTYKKLGIVNELVEIRKAGDFYAETDPGKASRFYRAIDDILSATVKEDKVKAIHVLDEVMPEVLRVVEEHESKTAKIHKDISI